MDIKDWPAQGVRQRKISTLKLNDQNARIHSEDQVRMISASIKKYGWTIPVLIDEESNVIAGHGRLMAAVQLEIKTVPCMIAKGWTETQKRAYALADNRLAEVSNWDDTKLFGELEALAGLGEDLFGMGFDTEAFPEFAPSLDPTMDAGEVSEEDLAKAAMGVANVGTGEGEAIDVVCPHCGEEFSFAGN